MPPVMDKFWVPTSVDRNEVTRMRAMAPYTPQAIAERRDQREQRAKTRRRTASGGSNISFASGKPLDPTFYTRDRYLPWDINNHKQLAELRSFCRMQYIIHPVLAACIDVFSQYPLIDMELQCKDSGIEQWHTEHFLDYLDYPTYLIKALREYFLVGEGMAFGQFAEDLGAWESDELLNPDDIYVEKLPFLKDPVLTMVIPESIRAILQSGQPAHLYERLIRQHPDLKSKANAQEPMGVSSILLKHWRFDADVFNPRGIPLLLRAMRAITQEEMLNSAQDAISSRIATPFILAKIGASATDLGTEDPWLPSMDELSDFEEAVDAALAADFRLLVHNFAISIENVFGKEMMPDFGADFERLESRMLQTFGMSKTLISGAGSGETYAADAINRDLMSRLLQVAQKLAKNFYKERALVVAEAQGHWDWEMRGGKKYPIMEEVLEIHPDGHREIVEQPKLLVPELQAASMNMREDERFRQFVEQLRAEGVPISMETRLINIPIDLEEEREKVRQEAVDMAVEAQETRKQTYLALKAKGLPLPPDLKADFDPVPIDQADNTQADPAQQVLPMLGLEEPSPTTALVPTPDDLLNAPEQNPEISEGDVAPVVRLPSNHLLDRVRPMESDEQRAGMPRPAKLASVDGLNFEVDTDGDGEEEDFFMRGTLSNGPAHVGMRRYAGIRADAELEDRPRTSGNIRFR